MYINITIYLASLSAENSQEARYMRATTPSQKGVGLQFYVITQSSDPPSTLQNWYKKAAGMQFSAVHFVISLNCAPWNP